MPRKNAPGKTPQESGGENPTIEKVCRKMTQLSEYEPAESASAVIQALTDMVWAAERTQFDAWYVEQRFDLSASPIGSRDYTMQWKAWVGRATLRSPCRGVRHAGCGYLAPCGSVCNKCGQVA